jgi:hypothetical protein
MKINNATNNKILSITLITNARKISIPGLNTLAGISNNPRTAEDVEISIDVPISLIDIKQVESIDFSLKIIGLHNNKKYGIYLTGMSLKINKDDCSSTSNEYILLKGIAKKLVCLAEV